MPPAWVASYVIGLAMNTGWDEQYILWELPLARGLQYQHAALYANGAKTVPSGEAMEDQLRSLEASL
jgi:hypothetical protein